MVKSKVPILLHITVNISSKIYLNIIKYIQKITLKVHPEVKEVSYFFLQIHLQKTLIENLTKNNYFKQHRLTNFAIL